jgi:transposase, IS5 family
MILDRHEPTDLVALVPELRLEMKPELAKLDKLLEDDFLFAQVKADLCRRYPNSETLGRRSTPVEVILRMLVVKRLYDFSYEECERFVCRLHHSEAVLPAIPAARSR